MYERKTYAVFTAACTSATHLVPDFIAILLILRAHICTSPTSSKDASQKAENEAHHVCFLTGVLDTAPSSPVFDSGRRLRCRHLVGHVVVCVNDFFWMSMKLVFWFCLALIYESMVPLIRRVMVVNRVALSPDMMKTCMRDSKASKLQMIFSLKQRHLFLTTKALN